MAISTELRAQILRYHHVEHWRVGTIARQLGVHHTTVDRVLAESGLPKAERATQPSMIDPFRPFVAEQLERFPTLTASALYGMVCERGYPGSEHHFRHQVALLRPRKPAEAYLRLRTLPGEQGQVDWGHFGSLTIGRAKRSLMAFVMVLSYSRRIYLRFFLDARMENFLRGHQGAFEAWDGLPRVLLYDNLKSAVLERRGEAIRFHPTLLEFAAHYRFEPRPVAVARGNEKGRVERAIRYIRENFFAARPWRDLEDLNAQARSWCEGPSLRRPCPEDRSITVREAFEQEHPQLVALPENPFPTDEQVVVSVGKTPYVRFDLNDYSVPHTHVRRSLTVHASPGEVRVLDGGELLARHPRSYDKGAQIEDPAHIEALVEHKRGARHHRGQDRLTHRVPNAHELLVRAAEKGDNLGSITAALLRLLDEYGAAELEAAIADALGRGVAHPNAVRLALQRRREARDQPPPLAVALPEDPRLRNLTVRPHALGDYDRLHEDDTPEPEETPTDTPDTPDTAEESTDDPTDE
ncbi:IS21 family transposase [Endothiovibrio diazotrophicus]